MEWSEEEGEILPEIIGGNRKDDDEIIADNTKDDDEISSKIFIDDDRKEEVEISSDEDDDVSETNLQFDPVCSICDNGGYVLCCEGSCLRSFHPTVADGHETACESLGFTDENQYEALGPYMCDNCLYKQHQCFACGKLGSSDETSSQEVFPCSASNCGHFYHPKCVAKLLHAYDEMKSEELEAKIATRESFCCPLHICKVCGLSENKNLYALHFAVCRRCPTAYHRKCLPREITTELNCDEDNLQRAWENLLYYNRILIYCLNHEIEGQLLTPARDHLIFPSATGQRRTQSYGLAQLKEDVQRKAATEPKYPVNLYARLGIINDDASWKPKRSFDIESYLVKRKKDKDMTGRKFSKDEGSSASTELSSDSIEREAKQTVMDIYAEVESEFNAEEFIKSHEAKTHVKMYRSGGDIGKNITTGLVQTHVNAARAALKMFERGHDEAARATFDPDTLIDLMKLKRKLEVYLSPFLHGMRYTSFGRHFTKQEKLKQIVERLHLYVENGDTVVDFCCGSNDFSLLMKEKLEKTGKSCFFKNFDLIPPKNDFNFELRDWLTVKPEDLDDGSRLIMGLNPPFGTKAGLANMFIRKALEFKPKILILIVPSETKRVDAIDDYDLIWKDTQILSGMSFYLPGSIDVNEKTIEQWNNNPPPLYLWSRRDWSRHHKNRAVEQGHIAEMHHCLYNYKQGGDDMVQDMEMSD